MARPEPIRRDFARSRRRHPYRWAAPLGWLIESPKSRTALAAPWLADFGLVECQEPGYTHVTIANVQAADATLWFGRVDSPIAKLTLETLGSHGKTNLVIIQGHRPSAVVEFFRQNPWIKVVNITGNSESRVPGIGARTERFLADVFRQLRASEGRSHPADFGRSRRAVVITGYEGSPHEMDHKSR